MISIIPGPEYKAVQTGQTKSSGVEFDLRGEVMKGVHLIFNYAFSHSEVTKDEDASKVGKPLSGTGIPRHISNGWANYCLPVTYLDGVSIALGYQLQAGRPYNMPNYLRVDGSVSWRKNMLTLKLNGNNLLNKYLYSGATYEYNNDPTTTEYYFQVEPGINYRLLAALRF
jgi:iron complex outermembrane receptor protein